MSSYTRHVPAISIEPPLPIRPCCELCGAAVPTGVNAEYLRDYGWLHWATGEQLRVEGRFAGVWLCRRHDGQVGSAMDTLFDFLCRHKPEAPYAHR